MKNINWSRDEQIILRSDGSYVVVYNGFPYHVPNEGEYVELYAGVNAYAQEHPELVEQEETLLPPTEEEQLARARAAARQQIDAETSAAILAGFDYAVDTGTGTPETLHFSYDSFDQQNFADTASMALLNLTMPASLDAGEVPTSVTWNAYRNYTPQTGGELVRLTFDAPGFLALYTGGALAHKALQMELGGQKKAAVEAAATVEEVEAAVTGTPSEAASGAQA
ncbi:MAG TPA: hypothetical protein IAB01_02525 [Candidatus Avidesulfovibrio excrementigallinarum]|nr:hypothetical protein [Candidatus Avidesulfovibrio excrementigallinarum]